jgi:hypothetical protein
MLKSFLRSTNWLTKLAMGVGAGGLLTILLGAGCKENPGADHVWEGLYSSGFEVSAFSPCGSDESWWVEGGDIANRYQTLGVEPYERVYVRLKGEVSDVGKFGHLGVYERAFTVTKVLEIRRAEPEDCQ